MLTIGDRVHASFCAGPWIPVWLKIRVKNRPVDGIGEVKSLYNYTLELIENKNNFFLMHHTLSTVFQPRPGYMQTTVPEVRLAVTATARHHWLMSLYATARHALAPASAVILSATRRSSSRGHRRSLALSPDRRSSQTRFSFHGISPLSSASQLVCLLRVIYRGIFFVWIFCWTFLLNVLQISFWESLSSWVTTKRE